MPDAPKIIKPGQVEVKMNPQEISPNQTVQVQLVTPEKRVIVVLLQVTDYNWEKDKFLISWGSIDMTEAAKQGLAGTPKGLIS